MGLFDQVPAELSKVEGRALIASQKVSQVMGSPLDDTARQVANAGAPNNNNKKKNIY